MKLAKITHERCDEYDGYTYVVVPDEMTQEEFDNAVYSAQKEYIEFVTEYDKVKKILNESSFAYNNPLMRFYDKYPDKTVAEVKEIYAAKSAEHAEASKLKAQSYREFGTYLKDFGITPLVEYEAEINKDLDWGHRHGSSINHERRVEDMPGPEVYEHF